MKSSADVDGAGPASKDAAEEGRGGRNGKAAVQDSRCSTDRRVVLAAGVGWAAMRGRRRGGGCCEAGDVSGNVAGVVKARVLMIYVTEVKTGCAVALLFRFAKRKQKGTSASATNSL